MISPIIIVHHIIPSPCFTSALATWPAHFSIDWRSVAPPGFYLTRVMTRFAALSRCMLLPLCFLWFISGRRLPDFALGLVALLPRADSCCLPLPLSLPFVFSLLSLCGGLVWLSPSFFPESACEGFFVKKQPL